MHQLLHDSITTAPLTGTTLLAMIVILIHSLKKDSESLQLWVSLVGLAINIALAAWTFPLRGFAFSGMLLTGGYSSLFSILFLGCAAMTMLLARDYIQKIGTHQGEFYILILLSVTGMITFASGKDLIITFIGLEIMSVCLYVLAGFPRRMAKSNEAALKYFLLGAFATGFFLYGIALIYGSTGTTNITAIAQNLAVHKSNLLFQTGIGLLLIGFAFKVGAVPFHSWVPDVYEGSPTVVTAFMSTGAKAAAFAALALVFTATFDYTNSTMNSVISVLAVASMVIGNVVAISQSSIKRMLAYSSIAHAGYMLVGITAGTSLGITGVIFYLISYTFTNLGAFGIASIIETGDMEHVGIENYNGLGKSKPMLAALMSIFMFSLIGLPPFSGFFGKYFIFYTAIKQGYTWLTIVGVVTSMVSVYYYLRVVMAMYFRSTETPMEAAHTWTSIFPLAVSAVGVILLGIIPRLVLDFMGSLF